jgi:hypothetical protein
MRTGVSRLNATKLEELEAFLECQGILWQRLERKDHDVATGQWTGIFGNTFNRGIRHRRYREGNKARYALSQVDNGDFLIFSIVNETPLWRSSEKGPRWGYACKALTIPDLSQFHNLDFVMAASDFAWTMVYTHEDDALGGPYFVDKNWVVQPDDGLKPGNLELKHRRGRR